MSAAGMLSNRIKASRIARNWSQENWRADPASRAPASARLRWDV